jgi:cell division protein FtsB
MALEDTNVPYEILVRFGTDGLPRGAHCQYLRRVVLDGEVLKEEIQPAQPIDLEGFPTSTIMSDATRDALAQVAILRRERDDLQEQMDLLAKENEDLIAEAAALRTKDDLSV